MRASDLLGRPVIDVDGRRVGVVTDLRCVKEAAPDGAWGVLRLDALVVDERQLGARLGYDRHQRSPALLGGLMRRLHGRATVIPWSSVESWTPTEIRTGHRRDGLGTGTVP
jgi:hypothetical protein